MNDFWKWEKINNSLFQAGIKSTLDENELRIKFWVTKHQLDYRFKSMASMERFIVALYRDYKTLKTMYQIEERYEYFIRRGE